MTGDGTISAVSVKRLIAGDWHLLDCIHDLHVVARLPHMAGKLGPVMSRSRSEWSFR